MTKKVPKDRRKRESFIEDLILAAQQEGEFDNLPRGPMELGDPDDDLWWVRKKLERERLQVLPPALEIRLDLERTLERIGGSSTAGEVRREVESLNERIKAANQAAVWGPPATTMPLDGEAVVRTWEARRTDSPS